MTTTRPAIHRPERPRSAQPASRPAVEPAQATPAVAKLANLLGVNLAQVTGTGVGGRTTKTDVQAASSRQRAAEAQKAAAAAQAADDQAYRNVYGSSEPVPTAAADDQAYRNVYSG